MIRALIFDVFGTCTDWRSSVAREVAAALPGLDATAFADAWRGEYQPAMERIRSGARSYTALDDLHRENLDTVCTRFGVTPDDPADLARAWERLDPWSDVPEGLARLRRDRIVAPCSNGSIALMTRLARHAGLGWDCILGAEIARAYKPDPAVYRAACAALRLAPQEVMMVAAHNSDLAAARAEGLATAFVLRPTEHGPEQATDLAPEADWDVSVGNFTELAEALA
ncbi:2-haloacid dehalogenase [Palleronia aestuarii]|uniref:(S)-2-haloacid dehalogenase n=1 Tax=Palleronia aestuarii TaxID=568105 RepID=A0A2W7NF62_9RHOB|nr:haloacid dehalogenase type II [Palleronia aestuarii]PZX18550.1 2-haloacid dehalogenase [Palleronia aestuarii]